MENNLGRLRAIEDNELALILSWRNAPSVRANMYTRHEISLPEHLEWWERTRARHDQLYRMYEYQGEALGIVAFTSIDRTNHNASWAFYASPEAPRGTGSSMEFLALEFAFSELQLHKLYCEVLAINPTVIKLHQKFGFQSEGLFREQHIFESNFIDIHRLGILATEWQAIREIMSVRLQRHFGSSNKE